MVEKTERNRVPSEVVRQSGLALLTDVQAILQQEKRHALLLMVIFPLVLVMTFVIWVWNSPLGKMARGQGSTIPGNGGQVIRTFDPDILKTLEVREGDIVKKGQVLLTLDDTQSPATLREGEAQVSSLEAVRTRLRAGAYFKSLTFSDDVSTDLRERESTVYRLRKTELVQGIADLKQSKTLLDKEIAVARPVVHEGTISEVELLRVQHQLAEPQLQMDEKQDKHLTEVGAELVKTEAESAQTKENMADRVDPIRRSCTRAPLRGIMRNTRVNILRDMIFAGQDTTEVISLEDQLLIEVYINPQDTACVGARMLTLVELMAYGCAIHGGLDGVMILVSPDTLRDQRRPGDLELDSDEACYRVLVITSNNYPTDRSRKVLLATPGMIASMDIKVDQKSVSQYLVKPIIRMEQAPQER